MDSCFSRKLFARNKKQTVSSKIWTRITDSFFLDDNHYAEHTSILFLTVKLMPTALAIIKLYDNGKMK